MKTERKLNVRLLRKIQKKILAEPLRMDMDVWAENPMNLPDYYRVTSIDLVPSCNTVGCIAGWTLLEGGATIRKIRSYAKREGIVEKHASKLLGIQSGSVNEPSWSEYLSESARLFLVENWPEQFESQYEDINRKLPHGNQTLDDIGLTLREAKALKLKLAKVVVRRIDHFIKTRQ